MSSLLAALLLVQSVVVADATPPARAIKCNARRHHCTVSRAYVDEMLANTDQLASTVRVVPSLRDGEPDGYRLYAMKPGSVWLRLGLQNGDTVQAVNGYDVTTPQKALLAYLALRNTNELAVRIVRHGAPLTLTYEIR